MENQMIDFSDLTSIEVPVNIKGTKYVLLEATGEVATKYLNFRMSKIKFTSDGKPNSTQNIGDIEPFLVSMCLFLEEGRKPVSMVTVQSWPYRVQKKLFEEAKKISGLDKSEIPYRDLLQEALNNPEAPITAEALVNWLSQLADKEKFKPILDLFEDSESSSKN